MGNAFQQNKGGNFPSEIQYEYFTRHYTGLSFPKNLKYPLDDELYSIISKDTNQPYTLKRMTFYTQESLDNFLNFLENVLAFHHSNILSIESYFIEKNYIKEDIASYTVNIIMEAFDHTLKEDMLIRQREGWPFLETRINDLLFQMNDALSFLQLNKVNHGTLSPQNIYVTNDNVFKICFVGEAFYKNGSNINPNIFDFMDYLTPKLRAGFVEALGNGNLCINTVYDKNKADVFSLGLILLQMASLQDVQGFNLKDQQTQRLERLKCCYKRITPKLINIVEQMLLDSEDQRPSFWDIKNMLDAEDSKESEDTRKLIRDSFVRPVIKKENSSAKKQNHDIELKIIEDHSGDRVSYNYPFDVSLISEDPVNESPDNRRKESSYDGDLLERSFQESFNTKKGMDPFSLADGYFSKRYMENSFECESPLFKESWKDIKRIETEEDTQSQFQLTLEETFISKEEMLLKSADIDLKRIIIKLTYPPREKKFGQTLAMYLAKQKVLEELIISLPNVSLEDKEMVALFESMTECENLRILFLELRTEQITKEAIQSFGTMIKGKKQLSQLGVDLANCRINDDLCKELAFSFEGLEGIRSLALNLGNNSIQNEGIEALSPFVEKLVSLESLVLFLYTNKIEKIESLISNFKKLDKLKSLSIDLSDNPLEEGVLERVQCFLKESQLPHISFKLLQRCLTNILDPENEENKISFKNMV